MARESKAARLARAEEIFRLLAEEYPDAHCELDHESPFQLAVATILSAQTTDARVNQVTPALFEAFPDAASLAGAPRETVEELVRSTGFFRNKARNIVAFARALVVEHDGEVPRTMAELRPLPGVGRKTANVILGNAFGIDEGVVVDTHVKRLSLRMGLTRETTPEKVEKDLMAIFPPSRWTMLAHLMIWHGRRTCDARKPECSRCVVRHLCPSSEA